MNIINPFFFRALYHIVAAGLLTVILLGCDSTNRISSTAPSENDVLVTLASSGFDTYMEKVTDTAQQLDSAVKLLCDKKDDASLNQARQAWKAAYLAWCQATPFFFGPAETLENHLEKPTNEVVLKSVVEVPEMVFMGKGVDARGYGGVEYLLFVPENGVQATSGLRCRHLIEISEEIVSLTSIAKTKWDKEFREGFVSAGNGLPYMVPGDALSLVVAKILNSLETVLRDKIYLPSNFSGTRAKPELLEARYSKSARDGLKAFVDGIDTALNSGDEKSITQLIATKDGLTHKKDPKLAMAIRKELINMHKSINELRKNDQDLYSQLQKNPKVLKRLYKQMQKLQENVAKAVLVLELDIRYGLEKDLAG